MAPEIRPITICWYEGSSSRSGCILCAIFLISWYAVKLTPEHSKSLVLGFMLTAILCTLVGGLSQRR